MASFTGKAAGNWSAVGQTTWNEVGTPAAGDTVDLNGQDVVMDIATIPAGGGALTSLTSPGTAGKVTVAIDVLGDCAINCNQMTGGTGYLIWTTGAAGANTLTVTGDVTGGAGTACLLHQSTATLAVVGNVTGGPGASNLGLYMWPGSGPLEITGTVTGGGGTEAYGVNVKNTSTASLTGSAVGGSALDAAGLRTETAATVTITGSVTGGASGAPGLRHEAGSVTIVGNVIDAASVALSGLSPTWSPTSSNYHQLSDGTKLRPVAKALVNGGLAR